MLVNTKDLLTKARAEGYAVPAFNITDLQSIITIMDVCQEENAPCLLEAAEPTVKSLGADILHAMIYTLAKRYTVPVALHFDHGRTFEIIMQTIRAGFTSVMIDWSDRSFEENAAETKKIVAIAHACGVSVESEIGVVGSGADVLTDEEREATLTKVEDAKRFYEETGVDFLAVGIGTAHGMYKAEPKLDLERLEAISKAIPIPLVLHGGSGTPRLEETPPLGISKVNVFTDLQIPVRNKAKEILTTQPIEKIFPVRLWTEAHKAAAPVARGYLRKLGASGKA